MGLVFSHNLNDIVSMTALLPLLTDRLNDPLNCIEHAADLYEAGRLLFSAVIQARDRLPA
jgi:hypothetical protein